MTSPTTDDLKKQTFERSPLPIIVIDPQTHAIIDCNIAAVKTYRYSSKEKLLGKTPIDLSAETQHDGRPSTGKLHHYVELTLKEGSATFDWSHRLPDGELWDAEVHMLRFEADGRVLLQYFLLDVTSRRSVESIQRLLHDLILSMNTCTNMHEGLTTILNSILKIDCFDSGEIFLVDPATRSLDLAVHKGLSERFVRLTNHYDGDSHQARSALEGGPFYGTFDSWTASGGNPALKAEGLRAIAMIPAKCHGELVAMLNVASHEREEIPMSIRAPLETVASQISSCLLRMRTDAELRESEEMFLQFMENMPSVAIIKDHELHPIFVNKQYLTFFPQSDTGKGTPDALRTSEPMEDTDKRALAEGSIAFEESWSDDCGAVRVLETRKFAIRRKNSTPYLGVIINDVTERRRTESTLQNTQKLESLGVLAGGIAHDFNNLLGGIFGYIDIARTETKPENIDQYLVKALSTIDRARTLTHQLLTFAKGGIPVVKPQNPGPLVREAVMFALSGTMVSPRFSLPHELHSCDIDKNQMSQVIDNIVINAVQAMPGGGSIDVLAENVSFDAGDHPALPAGQYVRISFQDYGSGICKEALPRIFDPFYTTKPKGHGLGLATAYSIIKRHGGVIDVESVVKEGSVFTIFLPVSKTTYDWTSGSEKPTHIGKGLFIIMDDESAVCETMGKMVESFGYTPMLTENGEDAISLIRYESGRQSEISGIILDLTVPGGIGGKEAITEIRKILPQTPAIVASGYADDPIMANPNRYGFTASILKPFLKQDLAELLNIYTRG